MTAYNPEFASGELRYKLSPYVSIHLLAVLSSCQITVHLLASVLYRKLAPEERKTAASTEYRRSSTLHPFHRTNPRFHRTSHAVCQLGSLSLLEYS